MLATRIPPPIIAFATAGLMYFLAQLLPPLNLAPVFKWAMIALWCGLGFFIELAAVWQFRKAKTTINPLKPDASKQLVTTGVFAYTRNPMYLGLSMQLMAFSLFLQAPLAILGVVVFIMLVTWLQILPEENVLQHKFPEQFTQYSQKVRRWV